MYESMRSTKGELLNWMLFRSCKCRKLNGLQNPPRRFGMSKKNWHAHGVAVVVMSIASVAAAQEGKDRPDYPPFDQVSKGYEKVNSTAEREQSLYTLWIDR